MAKENYSQPLNTWNVYNVIKKFFRKNKTKWGKKEGKLKMSGRAEFFSAALTSFIVTCSLPYKPFSHVRQDFRDVIFFIFWTLQKLDVNWLQFFFFIHGKIYIIFFEFLFINEYQRFPPYRCIILIFRWQNYILRPSDSEQSA